MLMHGFLFKKSGFYSKIRMARDKWQRRWVVLSDARLFYLVRIMLLSSCFGLQVVLTAIPAHLLFWLPAVSVPAFVWLRGHGLLNVSDNVVCVFSVCVFYAFSKRLTTWYGPILPVCFLTFRASTGSFSC